ncbi:MAG: FimV/HubP family polar landmark protein [Methylotetracoccus sp.]
MAAPKPLPLPVIQSNETDDEVDGFGVVGAFATAFAVALGGLLFWRRKLAQSGGVEDEAANEHASIEPASREQRTTATAEIADESEQTSDIADGIAEEPLLPAGRESRADQDDVDPIFESDVYLAYGRYKQAEEAMRSAISEHPDREAYRLKLLEVFVASQNKDEFEEYAARLSERGAAKDEEFWQKVCDMGQKLCPDSPLFTEQADSNASPVLEPEDETDRLIEDLRSFSLDIPAKSPPKGESAALDTHVVLPSLEPDEVAANQLEPEISRAIDWTTVDFDEPSIGVAATASETDGLVADAAQDERVIEFEPVAGSPLENNGPMAAEQTEGQQSIDEILKELSAIHYRRHQDTDPGESVDQGGVDDNVSEGAPGVTADVNHAGVGLSAAHTELDVEFPEIDDLETRLDLARAYADLEDYPQAIALLEDVIRDGTDRQKAEATELMGRFSSV